jgi:negative regulator of sigma E activity
MSLANETLSDFERNARAVLEHSVARIDGRTRSRLNQARQAALAAASARRPAWWRSFALMPAAGAVAAAVLVSVMLWHRQPVKEPSTLEAQRVEDLDMLADKDGLDLMEGGDGSFYEWAVAQSDNGASEG